MRAPLEVKILEIDFTSFFLTQWIKYGNGNVGLMVTLNNNEHKVFGMKFGIWVNLFLIFVRHLSAKTVSYILASKSKIKSSLGSKDL